MNVDDFMQKLSIQTASASRGSADFKAKSRNLEKISLNFPGNAGRYQIFPMNSVVEDYPFITLFGTREICIPRKQIAQDGSEVEYQAWVKILPASGYKMKDLTNRTVSSLTAEETQLLSEAASVFDQLYTEVDAKNNVDLAKTLLRKRNYTIFNGYCLNRWDFEGSRNPVRQNFSGLFVCTAKGFTTAVSDNIQEKAILNGGDTNWVSQIYNRETTGRTGFMMFSISRSKTSAGYNVTVNHEWDKGQQLAGYTIPEEDAELMQDPVMNFLGWQANRDEGAAVGTKRLFNAALIKEAIAFMTQQLAAVRMAKESGTSLEAAIQATNQTVLANSKPIERKTNDPMLAQDAVSGQDVNVNNVVANNDSPFQTPPAARIDPTTGAPVGNPGFGGAQEQQPAQAAPFMSPFGGQSNPFGGSGSGMPF